MLNKNNANDIKVQRQALLTKIVNLKLQQAPLLQKKLSPLLISQRLLQINRKQQQRQKQSGIKNLLLSRRLLKSHQIKKEHKQNRISQLMIQQLIANFKTSRQNITNVIRSLDYGGQRFFGCSWKLEGR